MSRSRPTIYDVAREAGVSKSLVSLVVRGAGNVSTDAETAVREAIRKLNYQPNRAASELAAKRTQLIAILIDDYANPWFVDLLQGLSEVLTPEGYRLSVIDSLTAGPDRDDAPFASALAMRPDGIIIARDIADLRVPDATPPFVIAGTRLAPAHRGNAVANDDVLGAEIATEHLITLGHSRIAHLSATGGAGGKRRESFTATMRAHRLDPVLTEARGPATEKAGFEDTLALLRRRPDITAIFASNDVMAIGALGAARDLGLGVPTDLSVVGYDNTPLAQARLIDLTTVDDDSAGVGRNAARLLLSKLDDETPDRNVARTVQPSLIQRGTCAPPRR